MAGEEGIEPTPCVLETLILPLNYSPIITRQFRMYFYVALPTELHSASIGLIQAVPLQRAGLEPTTYGLEGINI